MSHGKVVMWSKIELENKFAEIALLIFCEINDNTPGFCLVLSTHIHNPVKQIIWRVL